MIELARKPGSRFAFGSPGAGSPIQLAGAMFAARTKTDMVHVPYKGAGPAISALLSGEIQVMFVTPPLSLAHLAAGKLHALAYTGSSRAAFLPDIPTLTEAGVPGMVLDTDVHLKAGDVVIQRGTNHAWSNRSDKPCRMLYVLIDGEFDPELAASFPTGSGR